MNTDELTCKQQCYAAVSIDDDDDDEPTFKEKLRAVVGVIAEDDEPIFEEQAPCSRRHRR